MLWLYMAAKRGKSRGGRSKSAKKPVKKAIKRSSKAKILKKPSKSKKTARKVPKPKNIGKSSSKRVKKSKKASKKSAKSGKKSSPKPKSLTATEKNDVDNEYKSPISSYEEVTVLCSNCGQEFSVFKVEGLSTEGMICQRCAFGEIERPDNS